ncbi:hypothetical protein CFSAN000599_16160 [Salmonella enterica subsp. enterica serovar Newport str. CFSAN000599]|nr:hypothetical protein [Salmonella enterica subsp. enterica serovar Newport str. CFSAN000599]
MSVNLLPFGKTPEEAAHELTMNLLISGSLGISPETDPRKVFNLIINHEHIFTTCYQRKLDSMNQDE